MAHYTTCFAGYIPMFNALIIHHILYSFGSLQFRNGQMMANECAPPKKILCIYIYIIGVDSRGSFRYHWNHPMLSLLKTVVFHDAMCYVAESQSFPNLNEPENS